jgi:hypothetical protein
MNAHFRCVTSAELPAKFYLLYFINCEKTQFPKR